MTEPITSQDHLEFYLAHDISPVRQDISDLRRHLERRESLYRGLGVPAAYIKGKSVLEVGPGSGHNSVHIAACLPAALDLVEPNPVGRKGVESLYAELPVDHTRPTLIAQKLEDFAADAKYDLAIAEAWLGVPDHERRLMAKLASCVRPRGVLVTTLTSPIGMLANTLRRILGDVLIAGSGSLAESTSVLLKAFGPHLATLKDMSRPHEDWVQDSLLNPGFLTSCLTPGVLFDTLGPDFSVYGSVPKLATDWRWYKSLYGEGRRFNQVFLESYLGNCHNLFDYREVFPPRPTAANAALENRCLALVTTVAAYWERKTPPPRNKILDQVEAIRADIAEISQAWADGISEFLNVFARDAITPETVAGMTTLAPVFGRELLYISMIRDR